jgi:hypothetical protein
MNKDASATVTDTREEYEKILDKIRADYPGVTITVNATPEEVLRDAMRRFAPAAAEALGARDLPRAAELLVARLEMVGSAS